MRGAVLVALAAAVGNMLQGWDNSTIAGAVLYIKKELHLQTQPTLKGLIVATSLIGGTIIATFSGPVSDMLGRRPMLIMSAVLYFVGGLVMLWAPNVYVLLMARLLDGFGVGLAVTLVPVYISETAPLEIRGQLNTLPQLMGSGGMFVSYCMVFGMSLMESPSWRIMLGLLSIPSLAYLALTVFFFPESPQLVLQRLRGREDVSGELALLVEGLDVGRDTSIEEYVIGPANGESNEKEEVILYGAEEGVLYVAKPVTGQSTLDMVSRHGSLANQSVPLMDPLVTLFGSVHENISTTASMRSVLFPNMGSMLSMTGNQGRSEQWDEESQREDEELAAEDGYGNIRSPFLSTQHSAVDRGPLSISMLSMRDNSSLVIGGEEGAMAIGGGWQLAYKKSEKIGRDGKKEGRVQRVYLHQEGMMGSRRGSVISVGGGDASEEAEFVQASAFVSQPAIFSWKGEGPHSHGPAVIQPPHSATTETSWANLYEPGVKRALVVGLGLQILQKESGINGVLYYTLQILEQAGVDVLLSNLGLSSDSASLLTSLVATFLMLPCIMVAMRLMDVSGRRSLMLCTIPILVLSLFALVLGSIMKMASVVKAIISTASEMIYLACFVTGFGAIPNILCAEIFPTRVRGICITLCALTYWFGNIMIRYSLPTMLNTVGLAGVFTIYAIGCMVSWMFVFLKVPETKGMPLEVISEFFAVGATALAKND